MASAEIHKEVVNPETKNNPISVSLDSQGVAAPSCVIDGRMQNQSTVSEQQNQQSGTKSRSREGKTRNKDDKSVDHVLKALNSLNTTEEKLAAMCKKYADIFDENRKMQLGLKQAEKRCSTLQREKEQLQADHSRAILTRSRLENLCRELQRQNKAIKDESLLKIREEEEKRREVSAKFQATLNEITTLMQQNNDKNLKLRDDNIDMNAKLKNVCEQYELREQQVEKISKQMQIEAQLADAKLAKAKMEMAAEREIMLREKQQLLLELQQYQARCQEFQTTEISLRNQISMYDDKYDEFQKALTRSNEVFGGFKGEMEKMTKKMCKLEKEVSTWKQRWEGSHKALLEMGEEKQKAEQELNQIKRQLTTLQSLCRTLQGERTTLLAKLKGVSPNDVNKDELVDNKLEDVVEKDCCEPSLNLIVGDSSQILLNGDIVKEKVVVGDNIKENVTEKTSENSVVNKNSTIDTIPVNNSHILTNLPDSNNILLPVSCDSNNVNSITNNLNIEIKQGDITLSDAGNKNCELSEKNSLNLVKISENKSTENMIKVDVLPTDPVVKIDSASCKLGKCTSASTDQNLNSLDPTTLCPVTKEISSESPLKSASVCESSTACVPLTSSDTNSIVISSDIGDKKFDENKLPPDVTTPANSSVPNIVKDDKVSPDKNGSATQPVCKSDNSIKQDSKTDVTPGSKKKSDEQIVKKQNEGKKSKESKKKKKN